MKTTRLNHQSDQRPAACLFGDRLIVAWKDSIGGQNITLANGPAFTAGLFQPFVFELPFECQGGDLALAPFADRVWLAFVDASGALQITSSGNGASFDPPAQLATGVRFGVSLVAATQELLAITWVDANNHVVMSTGSPQGVFDSPTVLVQTSEFTPALAAIMHPYHGQQLVLAWGDGNSELLAGSANLLTTFNAAPHQGIVGGGEVVAACATLPPTSQTPGLAFAFRAGSDSLRLIFTNYDLVLQPTTVGGGPFASTAPAIVALAGDIVFAYVEDVIDHRVIVGSWGSLFGVPDDLRAKLGKPCDPRGCTSDPRLVCVLTGETTLVDQLAEISNARAGDLLLTPADGDGVIGTILKSLDPTQFYDHMGIMVADYNLIRHCTESKDRLMKDKTYFTGSLLGSPAPVDGLRPDLVKYGWPGPITQTIQDGLFDGWNSGRNADWVYHDLPDFGWRGEPITPEFVEHSNSSIRSLTAEQQLAFFDREHPETAVRITNLTWVPTYRSELPGPLWPIVVRPSRGAEQHLTWVRWALDRVVEAANAITGHYRFYGYTDATIATDLSRFGPPEGDPFWQGLPAGADWAAGTPGLVCSSFVWLAAVRALEGLQPVLLINFDPNTEPDEHKRAQIGAFVDGLFGYHKEERQTSAVNLHNWIVERVQNTVKQQADASLPALSRFGIGVVVGVVTGLIGGPVAGLVLGVLAGAAASPSTAEDITIGITEMPEHVANGICNAFANDRPQDNTKDATDWKQPGTGLAVSPDDIQHYWDAPSENPKLRSGLWGTVEQAMLANGGRKWSRQEGWV